MTGSTVFKSQVQLMCFPCPSGTRQAQMCLYFSYIDRCQQNIWNTNDNKVHEV